MRTSLKYKFLHWLIDSVFRTPEATIPCKLMRFIWHLFCPLWYFYEKQGQIKYDPLTNYYLIEGVKISRHVITMMKRNCVGQSFEIVKDELGQIAFKQIKKDSVEDNLTSDIYN